MSLDEDGKAAETMSPEIAFPCAAAGREPFPQPSVETGE